MEARQEWSTQREWTSPGGTKFYFDIPSAWALRHASEDLRLEVGRIVGAGVKIDQANLIAAVLGASKEFVEKLRDDLFQHVQFTNASAKTPLAVAGAEEMAFEKDSPLVIYKVLGRAIARFFYPSVKEILSLVTGAGAPTTEE